MAPTAFVTGISGQDGAYLAKLLVEKGYKVHGGVRRLPEAPLPRLVELGIANEVELCRFDLADLSMIQDAVERVRPDEFYNLGAQSFVGSSWSQPLYTADIDAVAVCRILEAIRARSPQTRFFQASTSEMFGAVREMPQSEDTPFRPRSPYGVAKLYGHGITVNYRESYAIHASCGILFNHESPLRGAEFVTRKITLGLARIAQGRQELLELGNLSAKRDWGFAGDYVEAMWRMLQQPAGDDFILATGTTTTVRRFVEAAGAALGLEIEWRGEGEGEEGFDRRSNKRVVAVNPAFFRPVDIDVLVGTASKARERLGWSPAMDLDSLAALMARTDHDRVARGAVTF